MDRRAFWKEEFEKAWRAGDKAGMVEAEKQIEAWTLYEQMQRDDQEKQHAQR